MNYKSFKLLLQSGLLSIAFSFVTSFSAAAYTKELPKDSLGVERKGAKLLVLHKVEAGETLSALSRRYNTSVAAIKEENALEAEALQVGAVLKVPYAAPAKTEVTGKKIHVVEAGQTLYAISKIYRVDVETLKKWNNITANGISLGQELIVGDDKKGNVTQTSQIPPPVPPAKEETVIATPKTNAEGKKVHVVEASQGLFSIAKLYNIPIENIRKWNNLPSDNLRVGQELYLEEVSVENTEVAQKEEPEVPKELEKKDVKATKELVAEANTPEEEEREERKNRAETRKEEKREAPVIADRTEVRTTEPAYTIANTSGYVKKVEAGLAEVIESRDNDMFLALHRTAPVGTIMQVRNQMNDLSVFVKVIGKLPDTGANDKVIVKISKKAYERLAAIDRRFRVEVSYMP